MSKLILQKSSNIDPYATAYIVKYEFIVNLKSKPLTSTTTTAISDTQRRYRRPRGP